MVSHAPKNLIVAGNFLNRKVLLDFLAIVYLGIIIIWSIFFGLSPWLYAALMVIAALFIIPNSQLGLGLIISFTMIFERFFTLQSLVIDYHTYKIYPLDIIIFFTAIGILVFNYTRIKNKKLFRWPEKTLLSFIILTVFFLIRALYNVNAEFTIAFSSFKNYAIYPIIYFLILYAVDSRKKLTDIIHLILITAVGLIIFIIIGLMRGQGLWTEFTPLSTAGTRLLAGTHAFYMLLAVTLTISLLMAKRFWSETLVTIFIWIWLFGIAASLMRHLWLTGALAIGVLWLLANWSEKKWLLNYTVKNALLILSFIALLLVVTVPLANQNLSRETQTIATSLRNRVVSLVSTSDDTSVNWRLDLWRSAQTAWSENPLFGVGLGKKIALETENWRTFEEIRNLHNSPLAIMVQMGLVGLGLLIFFIGSVLKEGWSAIQRDDYLRPYYLGLIACLAALIFASLFQPYLETNLTGIFLWLILGLIRTAPILAKQNENSSSK